MRYNSFFFKNFYIDSREVKENSIFICLKGENNDGHKYIKSTLKKYKKTIIVCENSSKFVKQLRHHKRIFLCNSTHKFLHDLAKVKRFLLNKNFFIGITGSSGKTTLKEMIYDVLKKFGTSYKSIKSYNNHIGLPLTLLNQKVKSKFNIYELGMNQAGEIDFLSKILKPDIGIITNIGEAHLGNLGSINNIAKAKSELIYNIKAGGTVILNRDCKFFNKLKVIAKKNKLKILSFGLNKKSTIHYNVIDNFTFEVSFRNRKIKIKLNHLNINIIQNILICFLILNFFKFNYLKIIKNFNKIKILNGRGNIVRLKKKNIEIIDDSYNSNPISLKSSIKYFDNLPTNKNKIVVIGDMLELGKFSKAKHYEIGKLLVNLNFNNVFLVGKETKVIFDKIYKHCECKHYLNINKFKKDFKNVLVENSIILFKASNGVGLYKLLSNKIY